MSVITNLPKTEEGRVKRGPGRPVGSINKFQKEAKDVISQAAAELGGTNRLISWAKEDPLNERAFWTTIYPKLLPLKVSAEATITVNQIVRRIVDPKCDP